LRGHLRAATKALRPKLAVDKLSMPKQVELLEAYALELEDEERQFRVKWPDRIGQDAAGHLRMERDRVLDSIAKLKIKLISGEDKPTRVGR